MDTPQVTRIGKYEIVDVLGRGGMGVVYRGIDKAIGREVAIKTLTGGFLSDPTMLARFYEEGRRTGRLKHPNIVTVYDLGDDNGTPYIVMERVEGDPLDKLIRSGAPLSMVDRLGIMEEVCSALGYAHRNNVIHRDVKPANIFLQPDGAAKLLDFGIARLEKRDQDVSFTRTGRLIGTVPYMAPERLMGESVDGRSDIFAAGVVLYQLVTGQLPFSGNENALMQRILNDPYPPLNTLIKSYPPILDAIIERSLAKAPVERYATAEEMAADLNSAIAGLRQEQVVELLPEAQRLVDAQEFTRARGVLHQLLKIDSQHSEARKLLSEIQRHFTQRQRDERIQQIRLAAEDAIDNRRFDQSLEVLADGFDLDAMNPELTKLRDKAKREKDKEDRVNEYLRQAESARRKGDFGSAIAAAQKALKIDKTNSKIVALCGLLEREAEQAKRMAQAKALLNDARRALNSRCFAEAIEILQQAEQAYPANPEIPLLVRDANSGLEQLKRRELVARLEDEVALAISYDLLKHAAQSIEEAMVSLPSESALFRLKSQVERQIKEYENRKAVDETVQACRDLSPRDALELVRKAMQRLPGDERLLSLEALLTDRTRQQTVEERRADFETRAREALKSGKYSDAVGILEFCQAEGLANSTILSLLDFARGEERENRRQEQLRGKLARAQSLIAGSEFDEAIKFLETALQQGDDTALRVLLDRALAESESLRKQIEEALSSARKLAEAGKRIEAVQLLRKQPSAVLRSEEVQKAIAVFEQRHQDAPDKPATPDFGALQELATKILSIIQDSKETQNLSQQLRVGPQSESPGVTELRAAPVPTGFFVEAAVTRTRFFEGEQVRYDKIQETLKFYRDHLNVEYKSLSDQAKHTYFLWVASVVLGLAAFASGVTFALFGKFAVTGVSTVSAVLVVFIQKIFQQREDHYRALAVPKLEHIEYVNRWLLVIQSIDGIESQSERERRQCDLVDVLTRKLDASRVDQMRRGQKPAARAK